MERSFNKDFLKAARWNYERARQSADEIPMVELAEDGRMILPEDWEDE